MNRSSGFRHIPILVLLAAALVVGILTLPDYGESWDEADIRRYSEYALGAYSYLGHPADLPAFETNLNLYGPAYFAAAGLTAGLLEQIVPAWSTITAWHAVYFITFVLGVLSVYLLAARWLSEWAALGAAVLFISQPLLWGHAFINPKDIAFMTFFAATIYAGFRMVDGLERTLKVTAELVLAAVLLGVTSSLRVLGPLAGMIVVVHALWRNKTRVLSPLGLYLLIAALIAFLCWPYLWAAPASRLVESLSTMADFPFNSTVLFGGRLYKPDELPITYFPVLLGIQLTESAILLITAGLLVSMIALRTTGKSGPLLLFTGWFVLPALVILLARSPLYDNARQLYFLLPPAFILAGAALDRLFEKIHKPLMRGAVILAAALPGILIGVRLHPYQYVYYNAFVNGTGGAFRDYEMDYWGTSFDELSAHMNAVLPAGSRVLVYGPEQIVAARARPDLQVFIPREDFNPGYDYLVLLTRSNADLRVCREAETIYSVGRRGAVFSELRIIPAGAKCQ